MANRVTELVTRLIAKDDASKVIEHVADEYDKLEKRKDVKIGITAEDKASDDIRTVTQRLAGLSDEDKLIVLRAQATDAERGIDRILRALKDVDKLDDKEVQIRIEALDHARDDLERIEAEMRDLDGTTAEVTVEARGLDDISNKLGALPGSLGAIGSSLGALSTGGAAVAGAGAIAAAMVGAATSAADMATEVAAMQQLTGLSAEDASRLMAVWETTGAEANDLNDVILQMNGVLADTPELAKQIGVNIQDGLSPGQRFTQVMELIRDYTGSAAEKAQLMSKLLGEEGARQGAKLLAIVEDIPAALEDIPEGKLLTDAQIRDALEMKAAIAELKIEFEAVAVELGTAVIPALTEVAELVGKIADVGGFEIPLIVEPATQDKSLQAAMDEMEAEANKEKFTWVFDVEADPGDVKAAWDKVLDVVREGQAAEDADDAAYAERRRARQKRLTAEMVASHAAEEAAIEDARQEAEKLAQALDDAAVAADETQVEVDKIGGVFEQMATRSDAISSIFDLKNAPLDAEADIRDVALAIEDLSEVDVDLSEAVQAEQIADKIDAVRPMIQERITAAFSGGGSEAAIKMAEDYIAQVAEELDISDADAAAMLGLDDITATIGVAVDQADLANAQAQLTLLTGIPGADPVWIAQVQLALSAGDITAPQASRLVQDKLRDAGVNIPASLVVPTTKEQLHRTMVDAGLLDPKPVSVPLVPDAKLLDESIAARDGTDITVDVYPNWIESLAGLFGLGGGGGTTGGGGADTFSVVPMATGTELAPVATTTSSAGPTMLMLPRAAPSAATTVNVQLNAAVIGSPFDVMRAVVDGTRKGARLLASQP